MRLCASRGRNSIAHCLLLMILPNSDWTNEQVQIFVTAVCQMTAKEADVVMANGLVTALAGHMFELSSTLELVSEAVGGASIERKEFVSHLE